MVKTKRIRLAPTHYWQESGPLKTKGGHHFDGEYPALAKVLLARMRTRISSYARFQTT
ncbi:AcvB/VirJ family lysyl-phosphatidylglycerol hydrolase [Mesorhizobium sp. ORM6]